MKVLYQRVYGVKHMSEAIIFVVSMRKHLPMVSLRKENTNAICLYKGLTFRQTNIPNKVSLFAISAKFKLFEADCCSSQ